MNDEIWTTKDGRKILVGEMSENHVRNALRMVLRNRRILHEQAPGTLLLLERLIAPVVRNVVRKDNECRAEFEQKLHESIMEEIGEDLKLGRD